MDISEIGKMDYKQLAEIVNSIESSHDKIFSNLPKYHEYCQSNGEANLHLVRAAIRLRERYSNIPFYKQRAEKAGPIYWINLATSAVNA